MRMDPHYLITPFTDGYWLLTPMRHDLERGRVEQGRILRMGPDRSFFCGMRPEFGGASVNHILST
jgi:hypothetical protein